MLERNFEQQGGWCCCGSRVIKLISWFNKHFFLLLLGLALGSELGLYLALRSLFKCLVRINWELPDLFCKAILDLFSKAVFQAQCNGTVCNSAM